MDRTQANEIQELLDGTLSAEESSELLHRLSVSPEKLDEFRGHLALRDVMARDASDAALDDEEDDALWAAVLGATGGLVTGGTAAGTGLLPWLGRGLAFLATGVVGFFVGSAVSSDDAGRSALAASAEPVAVQMLLHPTDLASPDLLALQAEAAGADRVDTLYLTRTVVEPRVVYRDRFVEVAAEGQRDSKAIANVDGTTNAISQPNLVTEPTSSDPIAERARNFLMPRTEQTTPLFPAHYLDDASVMLASAEPASSPSESLSTTNELTTSESLEAKGLDKNGALSSNTNDSDPNDLLKTESDLDARRTDDERDEITDDGTALPTITLMQDGFEIGYNERIGRVAPAPVVSGQSEPGFDARSLDLSWRTLGGRAGFGIRAGYGSFSRITYTQQVDFDLGLLDTNYVESLGTADEWSAEVFAGYRLPIATEQLGLEVEGTFGLSSSRFTVGAGLSAVYLITDWLGARVGAGYGFYRYTTEAARSSVIDQHENAGIRAGLPTELEGTLVEGHYGLFYRF